MQTKFILQKISKNEIITKKCSSNLKNNGFDWKRKCKNQDTQAQSMLSILHNEIEKQPSMFQHFSQQINEVVSVQAYFLKKQPTSHYFFLFFIITFTLLIFPTDCKCQKGIIDLENSYYNTCQMCYFQFSNTLYFLKCQQKLNCTKTNSSDTSFVGWKMFRSSDSLETCDYQSNSNYDSTQCQQLCCQHFNSATRFGYGKKKQETYTLQYCQDRKDAKSKLIVLLISLLTSPISVLLFCIIACKCMKKQQNANTLAQNFGKPEESFINENGIQLSSYNLKSHGPEKSDQNESCAICLQGHCNSYTNCGHYYHPKCLREWLIKRPRCPVCVSKEYNPVKIYCINCKEGAKMEILQRNLLSKEEIQKIQSLQKLNCQNCIKNPQRCFDQLQLVSSGSKKKSKNSQKQQINGEIMVQEQGDNPINQRSSQVKKRNFYVQDEQDNQTQRRLSSSVDDRNHQQNINEEKKYNYFNGSIKSYIKKFKNQNKLNSKKSSKNDQQNKQFSKIDQKQTKIIDKQTPSKLLPSENSPKHKEISQQLQISFNKKIQQQN